MKQQIRTRPNVCWSTWHGRKRPATAINDTAIHIENSYQLHTSPSDKIHSFKAEYASYCMLDPSPFQISCCKKSNVHGIHSLCSLFQQTYEEQLPNNSRECVSERFFCPAVPSAWLNCMQARVCGSNLKPL